MAEFALIDLTAQRHAVAEYVRGWQIADILTWMRRYGVVIEPIASGSVKLYLFESHAGFNAAFRFTEKGELTVIASGWLS